MVFLSFDSGAPCVLYNVTWVIVQVEHASTHCTNGLVGHSVPFGMLVRMVRDLRTTASRGVAVVSLFEIFGHWTLEN